jgi:hypothetical protein
LEKRATMLLEQDDDVVSVDARFAEMERDPRYRSVHRALAADFAQSDGEAWALEGVGGGAMAAPGARPPTAP